MRITETKLKDVYLIEPTVHGDSRGYFFETFREDLFSKEIGKTVAFCQDNESKSSRGILRGLHYQLPPFSQSKLVRVVKGEVLDVAVDIREGSPTFGQHVSVRLSDANKHQLFVPRGFAHGFVVLSEEVIFCYKVDNYYSAEHDRGIAYNDPALGIDWQLCSDDVVLSEKDQLHPTLSDAEKFAYAQDLYE